MDILTRVTEEHAIVCRGDDYTNGFARRAS